MLVDARTTVVARNVLQTCLLDDFAIDRTRPLTRSADSAAIVYLRLFTKKLRLRFVRKALKGILATDTARQLRRTARRIRA